MKQLQSTTTGLGLLIDFMNALVDLAQRFEESVDVQSKQAKKLKKKIQGARKKEYVGDQEADGVQRKATFETALIGCSALLGVRCKFSTLHARV
jgi:hypothetical protein